MGIFKPEWPVPKSVKSLVTTRSGGFSYPPYEGFNLGDHVQDKPEHVAHNRQQLASHVPANLFWLQQTHSTKVLPYVDTTKPPEADASYSRMKHQPCVVMTADCLPVLLCNDQGTQVAAAHAGWRGLLNGILENTISTFDETDQIMAYLGPAIGPDVFEVGQEVKDGFIEHSKEAELAFKPSKNEGKWLADIYLLARQRLTAVGVERVFGGMECTFTQEDKYFSYRRDGVTGRMASLIWIE